MSAQAAPARVLVVCTGNICRSPFAERVLTARLAEASIGPDEVSVASAGTHGLVGDPMSPPMGWWVEQHGGGHEGFVARLLTRQMIQDADLVLAATRLHRSRVAQLHPRATRYTFTIREVVRLVESAEPTLRLPEGPPSARLRQLVPQLAAQRGMSPLRDPLDDDVTDPYGFGARAYQESVEQMVPGIDRLVRALAQGGQ